MKPLQELLSATLDWSYPCFYELHYLTPSTNTEHRLIYQADSAGEVRDKVAMYLGALDRNPTSCQVLGLAWKQTGTFQEWFDRPSRSETKRVTKPVDKAEVLRRLLESEDL